MGAQGSSQRDGKLQEDASASASASASGGELSAEVKVLQEGSGVLDGKPLEKNGQISSLTSLNGHSEDNTLAEVGQPDGVSLAQKEEAPESTATTPVEGTPHVNGEKMDKESPSANDISAVEEKVAEEKTDDAGEVGFKKIFTIVGLKFTLKKDKSDETDPVTLLTVKDKEEEDASLAEEPAKDKEASPAEEKTPTDENKAQTEASTPDGDATKDTEKDESTDAQPDGAAAEAASEETKEETAEKEAETAPPPKETGMSPFRKLFFVGLFSNLRKKSSIKKTKEEEEKEAAEKEETAKTEEATAEEKEVKDEAEQVTKDETTVSEEETKDGNVVTEQETKEETQETPVEGKAEPETKEEGPITQEEAKSDTTPEATTPTETTTDQSKEDQRAESSVEEKVPAEVSAEAELQSSQEKSKPHGSPLKKLFTGAGLKKLSTKRQKSKKEPESKLTESGEQAADHPQSSAESEEAGKADSRPSSPEASGEHVVAADANQLESSQEVEGEVSSDGEKKKDSVIASFRKLVTPKKYAKRSSDSEDEGTNDKPAKSATLSSSESATLAEKSVEEEEKKEDKASEEEPKTENTEKLTCSTEETKKKMDTSVSWEALMCIGGPKKRTRKTSDSDDETKAEEEITGAAAGEEDSKEEGKNEEATAASQNPESEEVTPAPAPEPVPTPPVRESPWSTLKRLVMSKNKPKSEEKPDGPADQAQQDAETQKEESSFSLRKLFPGRKKKVPEKQASTDQGEEDSETPAVVPLSEYDEQVEAAQETPKEADTVQSKVSAEDRSPSWIPASVEDTADHHDQLSDIPEEAENAATPKSVDTDIAEDETDDQVVPPKGSGRMGRRLSTAEVKPITPAPAAATSPVPQGPRQHSAEEVIGAIEAQITALPTQTSVTLEDVPLEKASATSESEPETENAKPITVAILEPHPQGEAIALCTGLETKEIAAVDVEQPVEPTLEGTGLLGDATNVETVVEEKSLEPQEAVASEDPVLQAHVNKVQTLALEPAADKLSSEIAEIEVASESYEPQIEKVGAVSTENMEVIQPTTQTENSPKTVVVNAIEPLPEAAVCIQSVEVSEVTVESKEGATDVEEGTPTNIEGAETAVPAVVPRDESAVITETVVLVAPNAISGNAKSVATEQTKEAANEEAHKASEIETQSAVIAEAVIKDAVDKVLEDGPESKKPTATIPTPVQATATTESEVGIAADQVVITDTPIPDICERPIHKAPQPLCVAMEVIEPVPIEVTENIKEDDNEEEKPKSNLKKAVEVQVSEDAVVEEEVTEIKGEDGEEKKSKNEQEGAVKETSENGNKLEAPSEEKKEKEVEIHMPTHVVLQSAEEVEEQPVAVETVAMLDGNSSNTSVTAENPSRQNKLPELTEEPQETPCAQAAAASQCTDAGESQPEQKPSAKCVEVMAQVIEVIEEAVKEIEPVSKEITTAS
ncbi:A-kinase anchor protein 12b isoform X1 [Fundulus heteroclitus]|uniref:A-kinase anchor protein 12b isoform X1 n=1 Tax=Fundulus heteroclitus TaxID=8078 RepID=UPI00165ADB06|nr:A-kinase anchor protein 12b isoform X1 [Fundulus heteroclitus]